jgi:hypothetical protein
LFGTASDPSPPPLMFWWQIPQQAYNKTISDTLPYAILLHADKSWHQNSAHCLLEQKERLMTLDDNLIHCLSLI